MRGVTRPWSAGRSEGLDKALAAAASVLAHPSTRRAHFDEAARQYDADVAAGLAPSLLIDIAGATHQATALDWLAFTEQRIADLALSLRPQ
jgi:hypothetical protein